MKPVIRFSGLIFFYLGVSVGDHSDLVGEILKSIENNKDLTRVASYLERFRDGFNKDFPGVGTDGEKAIYTFFFPATSTFEEHFEQKVGDPFVLDNDFRRSVFLRHAARQLVTPEDLTKYDKLLMADSKEVTLTYDAGTGVRKINDAEINKISLQSAGGRFNIYIVDDIFMGGDEVLEIYLMNRDKITGFPLFDNPIPVI